MFQLGFRPEQLLEMWEDVKYCIKYTYTKKLFIVYVNLKFNQALYFIWRLNFLGPIDRLMLIPSFI